MVKLNIAMTYTTLAKDPIAKTRYGRRLPVII